MSWVGIVAILVVYVDDCGFGVLWILLLLSFWLFLGIHTYNIQAVPRLHSLATGQMALEPNTHMHIYMSAVTIGKWGIEYIIYPHPPLGLHVSYCTWKTYADAIEN